MGCAFVGLSHSVNDTRINGIEMTDCGCWHGSNAIFTSLTNRMILNEDRGVFPNMR